MNHTPTRTRPRSGLLAITLLVAPLVAQSEPAPLPVAPSAGPIRAGAAAPDGSTAGSWACGERYKVHFGDHVTFYPYVGPDLPHQPVAWHTTSVRAGGHELLVAGQRPMVTPTEWHCDYDHGLVVERYEVRAEGLEQSFLVAERPPAGELVVTGRLVTPLQLQPREPAHGPLSLHLGDGREVVRYGAAVCIDAAGRATPMPTAVVDGHIELRIPAAVMASAVFPLCIDPLIGTTLVGHGPVVSDVDVVHETTTAGGIQGRMWVAESRTVAANDDDVRMWRLGGSFGGTATEVFREISVWDSTSPRIAFVAGAAKTVIVFAADNGTGRFVIVHGHDVADMSLATTGSIVPIGVESHWRPDIGGRRSGPGSRVLIVYQREAVQPFADTPDSHVWGTVYDAAVSASPFVVPPFPLRAIPNRDQERPVVNQASASPNWVVSFQEHTTGIPNDMWDVGLMAVDATGNVSAPIDITDEAAIGRHKVGAQLAGSDGRFVVTYAMRVFEPAAPKPSSPEGQEVRAQRIDWDFSTNTGTLAHLPVVLHAPGNVTTRAAGLAFDHLSGDHWCAGVRHDSTTSYRVYKLGFTGNVVETGVFPLAPGAAPSNLAVAFNEETRSFPLVFGENDGSAAANAVQGSYLLYEPVAPPTLLGFSCGSGVWADTGAIVHKQQIGAQRMPLRLAGAPQDLAGLLFVSLGALPLAADPLGAPGCVLYPDLGLPNYLGALTVTIVGGAAQASLDLPEYLAPMTLTMQWAYLTPGANALGLQASEGLSVAIGR